MKLLHNNYTTKVIYPNMFEHCQDWELNIIEERKRKIIYKIHSFKVFKRKIQIRIAKIDLQSQVL